MEEQFSTKYEIMLILMPDLGEEKTKSAIDEVKDLIKEADGKILHEDNWGIRELAYRIKLQKMGYYVVLNFSADSGKVKDMEKQLNINPAVIRYLIIKTQKYHVIKTFSEYDQEAKEEKQKLEAEEKAKMEKYEKEKSGKRPERKERQVKKEDKKEEVKAVKKAVKKPKKEETTEEPAEEEKKPKTKKPSTTLEDVDAKLKSIIDDPDISL